MTAVETRELQPTRHASKSASPVGGAHGSKAAGQGSAAVTLLVNFRVWQRETIQMPPNLCQNRWMFIPARTLIVLITPSVVRDSGVRPATDEYEARLDRAPLSSRNRISSHCPKLSEGTPAKLDEIWACPDGDVPEAYAW